jgi:uncharacterized damage-inducible protein DinB
MIKPVLLRALDEAYEKRAWHGTNARGALRGLTAEEVFRRPSEGRHNIWELVMHMAYWKYAVRRRLSGIKRGSFARKGSNWFTPVMHDEPEWRDAVALLDSEHRALREVIEKMSLSQLRAKSHPRYDNIGLISGITAHDLYHTGQIQLLKRLS